MPRDAVFRLGSAASACLIVCLAMPAFAASAGKPAAKSPAKSIARARATKPTAKPSQAGKSGKHGHSKPVVMLERHVAGTKGGLPNVQALGALVIDEGGHELFSRNADRERPIASVSKLAAVLVVMDRGVELDGLSTISKTDSEVARGGARSRLLEGMTVSNRDLLHAALLGSDNRAIPALGRAVKLTPSQLAAAMTAKAKELGLAHTRFHDPTGLSPENVSTPRDTIVMLKTVMKQPVLAGITHRLTYEAHPVGRPPLIYNNTYKPAIRRGIEVLAGKTGYNDEARYCLVIATRMGGQNYFMSFLSNEGKLTRFGDVARVADWILQHKTKNAGEQVASAAPAGTATPAPTAASTATTGISAGTPTPTNAENVAAAPRTLAAKPPGPTVVAPTTPPLPAAAASPTTNPVAPAKAPVTNPPPASASPLIAPAVSPAVPVPTASDAHVPTAAGMATVSPAGSRVVQALAPSSSGSTP